MTRLLLALLLGAVPDGLSFTAWFSERGVRVEIARVPNGPPWVRGTVELPATPDAVVRVVTDFTRYQEIFSPAVRKAEVLDERGEARHLHVVWPYPFPYRDRDAVVLYRLEKLAEGVFVLSWRDDARPGDPKQGVRIVRVAGETRIAPSGSGSRVTYTYLGDLGGRFPRWAEEKAWRREPVEYVRALRRRLGLPDPSSESGAPPLQ